MQRKHTIALTVVAGLAMAASRGVETGHGGHGTGTETKWQTTCPVMGGKIDQKLYVDANGKRIYVCCAGCIDTVKKNPAKIISKIEDQGVTLARLQSSCPIMGGKINPKLYADVKGKRIYVCCAGCIDAVNKDPDKIIRKLEAHGVALTRPQSSCPIMGGKINPELYADVNGKRIYVCCQGCIGKIKNDPAKYIKKLEMSGVALDDTAVAKAAAEHDHGGHGH